MIEPLVPIDETLRLAALADYQLLDSDPEQGFDDLTRLAAVILNMPTAAISLVDQDRQWFKSAINVPDKQTPRDVSFCGHAILEQDLFVIDDALNDPRFADNPLRERLNIRFYAGTPLRDPQGLALGSLCVMDSQPRELTVEQRDALRILGRQVECQMNLRRTMRNIAASERFARSTIDALSEQIAILDSSGRILTANRAWQTHIGSFADNALAAGGAAGSNYLELCSQSALPHALELMAGIRAVAEGHQPLFTLEYSLDLPAGLHWFLTRVSRFAGSGPVRLVVSHENVTDRRAATEQLLHDSRHDSLTGLANRAMLCEQLDRCLKSAARTKKPFAVLFLDLDRFKLINDSLGHAAGDAVLQVTAERIAAALRSCDTVARLGGDEFAILLEQLHGPADVARLAERLGQIIAKPVEYQAQELTTTASIGIVTVAPDAADGQTARSLLRDADAAMYKAKAAGKDRFVVFDAAMHQEVVLRMQLEGDLRRAVEREELTLHYQPIVNHLDQSTRGFEALVRWIRPSGLVSPADFIPVAEDTGLIVPIGNWVLRQACRQLALWRTTHGVGELYVTVNVSRRQLADSRLLMTLQDVLAETQLPPSAVVLEITETTIMNDPAAARQMMKRLKAIGVRLSIDDFGTGYSSLACLADFPIDLLKIDRAFVQSADNGRQAAVLRTIIDLSHQLKMTVVAEGVETTGHAQLLSACGCDLMQGYLFSKPLPAEDAARFCHHSRAAA